MITSPILSRALGAEKLGIYSATLAFVNYFSLFAMLGVENYGNRSIAAIQDDKKKLQQTFWNIYAVQFISAFLAILAYIISFVFITKERYFITGLQGFWLIGCLFNINWFFFGTEQFKITVTRNIVIKLITVILIVLFVRTPDDIYLYTLLMAGDSFFSNIILWPFLKKNIDFEIPDFSLMKKSILPILGLFIPIVAMSVFHIMDKSMLDLLSTEQEVGYYYSADKVINIPLGLINAVGTVMLPRISNIYSKGQIENVKIMLKKSSELMMFLMCSIGIGIASIANEFVPFFFGAGFDSCIQLVYWFVPVMFAKAISDLIRSQYMIPAHKEKLYTIAVSIGAVANLICNWILITKFAALGAVWGTLIAEVTVAVIEIWVTRKQIPFFSYIMKYSIYVCIGIIMFFTVRIIATILHISVFIKLIVMLLTGGMVYLVSCLIYWKQNKNSIFHDIKVSDLIKHSRM